MVSLLDPNLTENPRQCSNGYAFVSSQVGQLDFYEPCIAQMSVDCKFRMTQGTQILDDPSSNCLYWRSFMETISINQTRARELNEAYLDPLKRYWCSLEKNISSYECTCLNAIRNAELGGQCQNNATWCQGEPQVNCLGSSFTKTFKGDTWNGEALSAGAEYVNFTFDRCLPYYCWADACWATGVYKTYAAFASQTVGCGNACITIKAENTISQRDQGSFDHLKPMQTVFPQCDKSSGNATLNYIPYTLIMSLNKPTVYIASINSVNINQGIQAVISLVGSTSDDSGNYWLEYPSDVGTENIIVPNGASKAFRFTINNDLLKNSYYNDKEPLLNANGVPVLQVCDEGGQSSACTNLLQRNYIRSPTYTFEYDQYIIPQNGAPPFFAQQRVTLFAHMVIVPPSEEIPNFIPRRKINRTQSPKWSYTLLIVSLIFFLVCFLFKSAMNHFALRAIKRARMPQLDL